jgi:hypothetical protein
MFSIFSPFSNSPLTQTLKEDNMQAGLVRFSYWEGMVVAAKAAG